MPTTVRICSVLLCSVGQTMIFFPTYKSANAADGPLTSRPAIGCASTNWLILSFKTASASSYTDCLVLPASVIIVCGARWGNRSRNTVCVCPTGMASTMMSAFATACAYSGVLGATKSSIKPSCKASRITDSRRPTPVTCCTTLAFFKAKVSEPPIKPAPINKSLPIGCDGS